MSNFFSPPKRMAPIPPQISNVQSGGKTEYTDPFDRKYWSPHELKKDWYNPSLPTRPTPITNPQINSVSPRQENNIFQPFAPEIPSPPPQAEAVENWYRIKQHSFNAENMKEGTVNVMIHLLDTCHLKFKKTDDNDNPHGIENEYRRIKINNEGQEAGVEPLPNNNTVGNSISEDIDYPNVTTKKSEKRFTKKMLLDAANDVFGLQNVLSTWGANGPTKKQLCMALFSAATHTKCGRDDNCNRMIIGYGLDKEDPLNALLPLKRTTLDAKNRMWVSYGEEYVRKMSAQRKTRYRNLDQLIDEMWEEYRESSGDISREEYVPYFYTEMRRTFERDEYQKYDDSRQDKLSRIKMYEPFVVNLTEQLKMYDSYVLNGSSGNRPTPFSFKDADEKSPPYTPYEQGMKSSLRKLKHMVNIAKHVLQYEEWYSYQCTVKKPSGCKYDTVKLMEPFSSLDDGNVVTKKYFEYVVSTTATIVGFFMKNYQRVYNEKKTTQKVIRIIEQLGISKEELSKINQSNSYINPNILQDLTGIIEKSRSKAFIN
jgi:hypothetical protein